MACGKASLPAKKRSEHVRPLVWLSISCVQTECCRTGLDRTTHRCWNRLTARLLHGRIRRAGGVCGICWERTSHVTNHHPADCLHAVVNIGNIPPFSRRAFRGKIYWFKGSKKDLAEHYASDFQSRTGCLRIAACQFPVGADIATNARWIRNQMLTAKMNGAELVHFPECALSGYSGVDWTDISARDWQSLKTETQSIIDLARDLKVWVLLGERPPTQRKQQTAQLPLCHQS